MTRTKKFHGKVGRSDLEGGYLTFDTGKQVYQLSGQTAGLVVGSSVDVEGHEESGGMGIGFGTPILHVVKKL